MLIALLLCQTTIAKLSEAVPASINAAAAYPGRAAGWHPSAGLIKN
jgi:hypothetical protein